MLLLVIGLGAMAQQRIQLRSADKAECVSSDMTSLRASFSFSTIEAENVETKGGQFSCISLPNTVIGGNEGDPQIPVLSELIAVPFGATPSIRVTRFSATDYDLNELGLQKLMPRQPDLRKDQRPEDAPFVYNESAYRNRGFRSEPMVRVSVDGVMRGVQVGRMSIEPISYDPVNNKIRVFNNIEVEVSFEGADVRTTEDMMVETFSPYFNSLYEQLFNGRSLRDVYDDHPDLLTAPVKMLVIANRMFEDCIQDWVAWKTKKGIYVDVNYTDEIGTTAAAIQSFIQSKYAQDHPTFLMIMGDKDQVAPSVASASETSCVTDLSYSSVDGDEFVDMFHSRFPAETVAQMTAMLNKALEYEQYTMPDPSYLNNVLLIAGEDSGWGVTVGRPTIWYASNYYYNAEHGFQNVYEFSHGTYTNCYSYLSSGVGFANYTAHGSNTSWAGPSFTVSDVNNLTNEHKYFLAMGNCCQAADWGISGTSFGEAMVRAENKGAYAYIGSCPSTYWLNDYYFGVGPTSRADGTMPTMDETGTGCYDAIWNDDAYNTVNSILYIGNLAGNAAQALGYELHISTLYYWQAYHVLGDGSIMPYRVQPTANQVSHMAILPIGMQTYEVSAVPGSYVAISKDGVLHGTALVGETGTVQVPITPITSSGDVTICVTAPNRIPYIQTVPAAALEGAYISMDSYTPTATHVGDNTNLSITFKNVGTDATTGTTYVTLSTDDPNVILNSYTGSFGVLAPEATTTVSGFSFSINPGVADGTNVTLHYVAENDGDTYEGNIVVKANEAVLAYQNMSWNGGFTPGETLTLTAKFKNTGHFQATNAVVTMATTSSNYLEISNPTVNVGTIAVDQEVSCQFTVTIAANCPETAQIPVTFTMTADGDLSTQGTATLKNACNVIFDLHDSYSGNDGWNGATLVVSFDDGTPSENLTIENGSNSATYTLEIGNGTHVTLTWSSGSYDGECSFTMSYEGDLLIYSQSTRPSAGVLYEFDCNCAAASQTFMITATSSNTAQGTVTGGGEFGFGQSCTVTATPAEGYMFTNWTMNGEIVSTVSSYTFIVSSDMNLVANFDEGNMIGDGGSTTSNYLPTYNYYNYSLTQQLYTSQELGEAGLITSVAFYNGGTAKTRTLDFYMKSTTKNSFSGNTDWIAVSASDKVFSGEVTMAADEWTFITFSTPFVYDGTSNVVLVTDDNSGAYTSSPHMACRVFNATSQAIYVYSDGTNYDPSSPSSYSGTMASVKNQLIIVKETDVVPVCEAPTNLTASEVGSHSAILNWTADGETTEWLLQYGTDNDFATGTFTEVNVSGEPAAELVELTAETQYYARVKTICEADNESVWSNTCTFMPTCYVVIGSGTGTNSYLPSNVNNKYSLTQQIYTVAELGEAGNIVSIGFRKNSSEECERNLEIYMVSTDKSAFTEAKDWVAVTTSNKVFSGTVSFADNDWTTITLDRAFSYDGTSNIAIMVDDNTGRAVTSTPFLSFPAGSQALRVCGRTTNYRATSAGSYSGTIEATKNQIRIMKVDYAPLCDAPAGLAVSEIDHQGAMLTWNGEADSWTVSYRPANTEVGTEVTVEEPSYTLTGLEAETSYKVKVAANCGDETVWSEEKGFTTQAAPCTAIVLGDDGAYRENFDNYTTTTTTETGVQPKCWEVYPLSDVSLTASTMPQVYRGFATSGSYSLRMKNRCVYAMPELDENIAIDQLTMTFNLRQPNSIYRLQVGVVNANGAFTLVKTINNAGTGIESVTVDFAEYTGDGHRIAFRNTLGKGSTLSYSYNYIDDIVITSTTATACGIDVLPYPEQFEGYTNTTATETGVQPDCWEVITEDVALSESTKPQLYRGYSTSGDYTLRLKNRCVYAMPEFTTDVSVSDLTMTFNLRQPNSNYRLQVGVLETDGSFTALKTLKSGTSMQSKTVNFSGYTGTGNRIAFRNTLIPGTGMSTDYLDYSINYIDDINLFRTTGKSMEVTAADAGMMGAGRDMLDVMVYPNPTKEFVNVQCTMYNVQCSGIEVVDVYGKVVRTDVGANNDSATQINVSGLAAGMYFVRVTTDKGVVTKPFVKK